MSSYHTLTLSLDAGLNDEQASLFCAVFEEEALSFSSKIDKKRGGWDFLWTFGEKPSDEMIAERFAFLSEVLSLPAGLLAQYTVEPLADKDWLAESYQALPPLSIGSFFIYGSHHEGEKPEDKIPLLIEAATAFGSGEHGTTSQCLIAIEHLHKDGFKPRSILDMGCGSGILAAGAAKLWETVPVFAADNDPECVRVTKEHLRINNLERVHAYESEGFEEQSAVWKDAPYDLIIANILAGPLIDMAQDLCRATAPSGYIILSGTLQEQGERVQAAYTPHGMRLIGTFPGDEWVTLLMQKSA